MTVTTITTTRNIIGWDITYPGTNRFHCIKQEKVRMSFYHLYYLHDRMICMACTTLQKHNWRDYRKNEVYHA